MNRKQKINKNLKKGVFIFAPKIDLVRQRLPAVQIRTKLVEEVHRPVEPSGKVPLHQVQQLRLKYRVQVTRKLSEKVFDTPRSAACISIQNCVALK